MNTQTQFPGWPARLAVTAVAVAIAMVAAAAIANVPRSSAPFEFGSAGFDGSVLTDQDAQRKAYAAAASGSYATGFVEFDDEVKMQDDGLGALSETSNSEIMD